MSPASMPDAGTTLRFRQWPSELTAVFLASDPGLLRLRLAVRAVVGVGVASLILHWLGPALGIPGVVAILLGGSIGFNGSFATSGRTPADAVRTVAFFPLVTAVPVALAASVAGSRPATLVLFVVIMVVAVYVRRFGPRWFNYGMVGWLAYFFTSFIGFQLRQLGDVLAVVAVTAACVILATLVVPDRPSVLLRSAHRAFDLRLDALLKVIDDALAGEIRVGRVGPQVHGASFRMLEAALIVDGYLAQTPADADPSPAVVRHNLLDSELAADELGAAVVLLIDAHAGAEADRLLVRAIVGAVRAGELDRALRVAHELDERAELSTAGAALHRIASAVPALVDGLRQAHVDLPEHARDYTPAVMMSLGNLPGTLPSAVAAIQDAPSRTQRLSQNTRLCVQVAVATSVTIAAGDALSHQRYYWAVLACFLALTGTFTTAEIAVKGASRVVGTLVGLVVATVAVHFTGQHESAIVAVMLSCVFIGLYFFRVSYAVLAFAITTIMGELYNVLHEFSTDLLTLRLAETAIGAVIGMVVALVLLPLRTSDVGAAARQSFFAAVDDVIREVQHRLDGAPPAADLFFASRRVDAALHQLALVLRPLGGATLLGITGRRARRQIGRFSRVAFKARATAAAAANEASPGATARRCADLVAARDELEQTQDARTTRGPKHRAHDSGSAGRRAGVARLP